MMRSLSSAVAGLRSHQTKMDVIGNNIANVNTYGYKSSRVSFSDIYYQTMSGASAPTAVLGGTNPTQIGYGATISSIDVLNTQSTMSSTDRAMDIYLNGDGMIATKDAAGNLKYTRLGILGFDAEGNLVDTNGNFVMGFPMDASTGRPIVNSDGTVSIDDLTVIKVDTKLLEQMTDISIGSGGDIVGILPGDLAIAMNTSRPNWLTNITVPDGSKLASDISATLDKEKSVTEGSLYADWVYSVEAGSGISGTYSFAYNRLDQTIIATGPNGEIYKGQYKKGKTVELTDTSGAVGFKVTTDLSKIPGTGTGTENLGTMTYSIKSMLTLTGKDSGGNTLSQSMAIDLTTPGLQQITFSDVGGATVYIDSGQVSRNTVSWLTYDTTNVLNGAITDIVYEADSTLSGAVTITLAKQNVVSNKLTTTAYSSLSFLDADKLNAFLEGEGLPVGSYSIRFNSVAGGQYTMSIIDSANAVAVGTSGPLTSDPFTLGSANAISFGSTTVGLVPVADQTLPMGPHTDVITVAQQNVIIANVGGVDYRTIYDSSLDQQVITDGNGNQIKIQVDTARMDTAFAAIIPPAQSGPSTVGTLAIKEINDWDFSGRVASADVGDGQQYIIGNIAVAKIPNMAGMNQSGTSYFVTTANSGEAVFAKPGTNGTGSTKAGYLEMSNVDIAKEFTDMITTQRGFQANSRIITVSDEMLQELVNLKR